MLRISDSDRGIGGREKGEGGGAGRDRGINSLSWTGRIGHGHGSDQSFASDDGPLLGEDEGDELE